MPIVIDLLQPASVLDVGCGEGTWLSEFVRRGVTDVIGIDGPHVSQANLDIPTALFVPQDLSVPFDLGRRFDLVVSLEVAEHLEPTTADAFVAGLVAHGSAVMFSAAIPFQGGAGHVNEQWPSYWAERFAGHGYRAVDAIRPRVWDDPRIAFWYAQNTILYVDESHAHLADARERGSAGAMPLDIVHPRLQIRDHTRAKPRPQPPSLVRALRDLGPAALQAVRRRVPDRRGHD